MIIRGLSGSGKTSFMSRLIMDISDQCGCSPTSATMISRFLGSTNSSSSARELMCSILEQIDLIDPLIELETRCNGTATLDDVAHVIAKKRGSGLASDFSELATKFHDGLKRLCSKQTVILLLDGLDQLYDDEEGSPSSWLPTELPDGLLMIISVLES